MPVPPSDGAAKTPVNKAPKIPPTPCTPNTSSESSEPKIFFRPFTPHKQMMPASAPITKAPIGPTKPAAGVIATKPATQPEAPPNTDGLPFEIHSAKVQPSTAAAVAKKVFTNASAAVPFASRAEPALKPNQPNQSSEAPVMTCTMLCGFMISRP